MFKYNKHFHFAENLLDIDNDTLHFTMKNLTFTNILSTEIGVKIISYATF